MSETEKTTEVSGVYVVEHYPGGAGWWARWQIPGRAYARAATMEEHVLMEKCEWQTDSFDEREKLKELICAR